MTRLTMMMELLYKELFFIIAIYSHKKAAHFCAAIFGTKVLRILLP